MASDFTNGELERFLDEALPPSRAAEVEAALRADSSLGERLSAIHCRRDAGIHSLGEIWRRHRVGCPTREEIGRWLLSALEPQHADYLRFHIDTIGCRICMANLADMQQQQAAIDQQQSEQRRNKYFQSSAGYLRQQ